MVNTSLESPESPRNPFERASSLHEVVEAIDFQTLNELLQEVVRRSGGVPGRLISKEIISSLGLQEENKDGRLAEAGHEANEIRVDWSEIERIYASTLAEHPIGIIALRIVIHEAVHIVTRSAHSLSSFNEAVTDQIALEVFGAYLHRTGNGILLKKEERREALLFLGYHYDRIILNMVIQAVAHTRGEDADMVWQQLVSRYMRSYGGIALLEKIAEELDDPTITEVVSLLNSETIGQTAPAFIARIGNSEAFSRALKRTRAALAPDNLSRGLGLR